MIQPFLPQGAPESRCGTKESPVLTPCPCRDEKSTRRLICIFCFNPTYDGLTLEFFSQRFTTTTSCQEKLFSLLSLPHLKCLPHGYRSVEHSHLFVLVMTGVE